MSSRNMTKFELLLEVGHKSSVKDEFWGPSSRLPYEGEFTHDWEVFVRDHHGSSGKIENIVEKIVFNLHETFAKPVKVTKNPPYRIKEQGYAGFEIIIDVYFKGTTDVDELRKSRFSYELFLTPNLVELSASSRNTALSGIRRDNSHRVLKRICIETEKPNFIRGLLKAGAKLIKDDTSNKSIIPPAISLASTSHSSGLNQSENSRKSDVKGDRNRITADIKGFGRKDEKYSKSPVAGSSMSSTVSKTDIKQQHHQSIRASQEFTNLFGEPIQKTLKNVKKEDSPSALKDSHKMSKSNNRKFSKSNFIKEPDKALKIKVEAPDIRDLEKEKKAKRKEKEKKRAREKEEELRRIQEAEIKKKEKEKRLELEEKQRRLEKEKRLEMEEKQRRIEKEKKLEKEKLERERELQRIQELEREQEERERLVIEQIRKEQQDREAKEEYERRKFKRARKDEEKVVKKARKLNNSEGIRCSNTFDDGAKKKGEKRKREKKKKKKEKKKKSKRHRNDDDSPPQLSPPPQIKTYPPIYSDGEESPVADINYEQSSPTKQDSSSSVAEFEEEEVVSKISVSPTSCSSSSSSPVSDAKISEFPSTHIQLQPLVSPLSGFNSSSSEDGDDNEDNGEDESKDIKMETDIEAVSLPVQSKHNEYLPLSVFTPEYLGLLEDIQKNMLERLNGGETRVMETVVGLIQQTGCFAITRDRFDFDLCLLDKKTVMKIQECLGL